MNKRVNNPLLKLLLIIELFRYIFPKSTLIANEIYNDKSIVEENKYIFNIKASLTGILSKNMFDNITITINNNDSLKALCIFPEEKRYVYNKTILMNCSINNNIHNEYDSFSLSFKGENKYIDLINFNENILYVQKTFNKNDIVLMLGEMIEQNCTYNNKLYYYNYKIKIKNKTIPKILEISNNNYDLKPNGLDNNKYNITCKIENSNPDEFFSCSLVYYKEIKNALYYKQKYVYKKVINNYKIYIINNNENIYVGKNVNCRRVNNNKNNNINKSNLRSMSFYDDESDSSFGYDSDISNDFSEYINSDYFEPFQYTTEITDSFTQKVCEPGYYLSDKCYKCFPICENCESLNNCTKCKTGYVLQNNSCISCFNKFMGCEKCSESSCNKCYNNSFFQYELSNGACENIKIEKNSTDNNANTKVELKFQRLDSYERNDNVIYINAHFILLNYYLYGEQLTIKAIIKTSNANVLRNLDDLEKDIKCNQYGEAFGNYNQGGYLVNFNCSFELDQAQYLSSIQPLSFDIGNNNVNIQPLPSKGLEVDVKELGKKSLELEIDNYNFNKMLITNIDNIKLDKKLTLNIKGTFDKNVEKECQYKIIIKKDNSQQIEGDCSLKASSQILSCSFSKDNIKEKEILEIEEGMYESNNEILIISWGWRWYSSEPVWR